MKKKGLLITYKNSSKTDIAKINYHLFGRITNINGKKYYYKGQLENIEYIKICNGCYFITQPIKNYNGIIKYITATIETNNTNFKTAKDYWKETLNNEDEIINWEKNERRNIHMDT